MNRTFYAHKKNAVLARIATLSAICLISAIAVLSIDSIIGKIAIWTVYGFAINGWIQLWHDSWHGTLFKTKRANALAGHLIGFMLGTLYEPARHGHMLHHKHNRTALDPDAYNAGKKSFDLTQRFYAILFFGLLLAPLHYAFIYPIRYFDRPKLIRHFISLSIMLLAYAALFFSAKQFGFMPILVQAWLIPVVFASPFNGLKSVADHYSDRWNGNEYETATTVTSNALTTYLWNGLNYHVEHHLYPQVPGHRLQELHHALKERLEQHHVAIHSSYLRVLIAALKRGPQIIDEDTDFNRFSRRVESV